MNEENDQNTQLNAQPENTIGQPEAVSADPERDALRDAVREHVTTGFDEPGIVTSIIGENSEKHELRGGEVIIKPINNEARAEVRNKHTGVIIGVFAFGTLLAALGAAKYHNRGK